MHNYVHMAQADAISASFLQSYVTEVGAAGIEEEELDKEEDSEAVEA